MQANDLYQIELFVLDSSTWNHWAIYKQMIKIKWNY